MDNWGTVDVFSSPNPTHSAEISISSRILNSTAGDIMYVALLVSECGCQDDPVPQFGAIQSELEWPNVMQWQEAKEFSCIPQYQTTPMRWRPFGDEDFRKFSDFFYTIGRDDCSNPGGYCNGHLRPNTEYSLIIRTFTRHGFSDSAVIRFQTDGLIALSMIIGIVTGCLLIAFIVGLFIARRSNSLHKWNNDLLNSDETVPDVDLKKFSDHYISMMRNSKENLTKEFKLLNAVTLEKDFSMAAAKQNETKNRYVNIVPCKFQHTMVKNLISEVIQRISLTDDMNRVLLNVEEGETEYINASYISVSIPFIN